MTKFKDLSKSKQTMLLVVIFIAALIAVFALIFVAILLAVNLSGKTKIYEGTYAYQGDPVEVTENLTIDYAEITFKKTYDENIDEKNKLNVYKDSDSYYIMTFKMRINGESQYRLVPLQYYGRIAGKPCRRYIFYNFISFDDSIRASMWLRDFDKKRFAHSIDLDINLFDINDERYDGASLKLEFISK